MYGNKQTPKAGQIVDKVLKKVRNIAQLQKRTEYMSEETKKGTWGGE